MPEGSHSPPHEAAMAEVSPRLSTASISSNEQAPSATPSDSSDPPPSGRRPLSLISTLSSGSGSSRDDNLAPPPPPSSQTSDFESDLDLNPAEGERIRTRPHMDDSDRKGRNLSLYQNNNNNSKPPTPGRAASRRQHSMAPNPQVTYLDRVVMEIIETERTYVRDLRMIVEDYLAHVIDQSDLSLRPEQVCALFGNIEDIYEFNSELLQDLDLCDHDPVAVARCFVMRSEYFEMYTQYCTNYPNSVAALTECMRNKSLAKFFRERQASLKRSLPLGSYLLKPVQRILKYHLLLQEIAKHFGPEEQGYEVVEDAIYTMTGVAWYINDMKRKHEHAVRLQEVQSLLLNWKGPDLTTYGELVLEGTFKVHRAKNERTLFLFERMLLITKRRGEHYVHKTHISCSTLMLIESSKDSLSFSVTHYKHPKQPNTVQAKTVEEKKLWTHHIKRLILENHHAVIPQKAKEAILEMDSIYPHRYRYSPERLKKALSCQSDEVSQDGRHGRRRSEPTKQLLKSTKAFLKDVDGGGVSEGRSADQKLNEAKRDEPPRENLLQSRPTNPHPEPASDPDPGSLRPPGSSQTLKPDADTEERSIATPESDSKTLSSGESSEDEEDEGKETAEKEGEASSILPSSVLDKASAIAQHFTNSIKRDESRSLGCPSPRLPSRTGSSLNLSAEHGDRSSRLNSSCSDPAETFGVTDLTLLSPRDDSIFDTERGGRRRRDSTLSKQDQLLIGKIKTYYENAENQDAAFSIRRRESLTYIPTGLVRNSVSRFNSVPKDEDVATEQNLTDSAQTTTPPTFHPSTTEPDSGPAAGSGAHMVSSASLDSGGSAETEDSGFMSRSQSIQEKPAEDEEFRPSSEMIRIWQAMEQETSRSQREGRALRNSRTVNGGLSNLNQIPRKEEESDLSTITEESSSPSPLKPLRINRTTLKDTLRVFGEEGVVLRAPVPRVAQLKAEAEPTGAGSGSDPLDDTDKTKSKVLNLARQYSQRIKTSRPAVQRRGQDTPLWQTGLPCTPEEKESSGEADVTLPRGSAPLSPVDQVPSPSPAHTWVGSLRPAPPTRPRPCRPLSPPPTEDFDWPDVRELRSKYTEHNPSQKSPVGRSRSVPDQMWDGRLRRRSSCSSSLILLDEGLSTEVPSSERQIAPHAESHKWRHRANSLDPRLSGTQPDQLQELQDRAEGYYIAAEAPLPNDPQHKIIIMEKLPEPEPAQTTQQAKQEEKEGGGGGRGDSYVQIRSPTSREKISIMAVIDRCRAYQESDEYKQRDDVRSRPEPDKTTTKTCDPQDHLNQKTKDPTESGTQNRVKNLREKFQSFQ